MQASGGKYVSINEKKLLQLKICVFTNGKCCSSTRNNTFKYKILFQLAGYYLFPEWKYQCFHYLENILTKGNHVLQNYHAFLLMGRPVCIVSKPASWSRYINNHIQPSMFPLAWKYVCNIRINSFQGTYIRSRK